MMYLRWAGVVFLAVGVAVCSLSLRPYRKGEKWSWYSLFIVGILPLIGTTIFDWQMGEMAGTAFALIGWILFIIAIGSPAKTILGKKPL